MTLAMTTPISVAAAVAVAIPVPTSTGASTAATISVAVALAGPTSTGASTAATISVAVALAGPTSTARASAAGAATARPASWVRGCGADIAAIGMLAKDLDQAIRRRTGEGEWHTVGIATRRVVDGISWRQSGRLTIRRGREIKHRGGRVRGWRRWPDEWDRQRGREINHRGGRVRGCHR
jgi:hypothetical protein